MDSENSIWQERVYPLEKDRYLRLSPGEEYSIAFSGKDVDAAEGDCRRLKLRFTGEMDIPFEYRCESKYPMLYRRLGDSLVARGGRLCLAAQSKDSRVAKLAYYKVYADEIGRARTFSFSLDYRCDPGVRLEDACVTVEVYYRGKQPRFAYDRNAEIRKCFPLSERGGAIRARLTAERPVDSILVAIELRSFEGNVEFDSPVLVSGRGRSLMEPFRVTPLTPQTPRWVGVNFSRVERPVFELKLNGTTFFCGESFERIYRWPAHEIELPAALVSAGDNRLSVRYVESYPGAPDFILRSVDVIAAPGSGVVACPQVAHRGELSLLVRTEAPDSVLELASSRSQVVPEKTVVRAAQPGLYAVKFRVQGPFAGPCSVFVLIDGKLCRAEIRRYVEKAGEDVLTGTGDSIYVNLSRQTMDDYLAWYFASGLGNLVTLRTTYRWSGTQFVAPGFWEQTLRTVADMGAKLTIMIDGRELPSFASNASLYAGDDPAWLGAQAHEQDGAYYYWGTQKESREDAFFFELLGRLFAHTGIHPLRSLVFRDGGYYKYFDAARAGDMRGGCAYFVENIGRISESAVRHSGASVLFDYFFQAGQKWLCAELMYGCLELYAAFLRGASLAHGQTEYGGHLAVQWSTTPHDDEYRRRRYDQALLLSYMNGLSQINTEEGCYRLEELYADFERDSAACRMHAQVQAAFSRFVSTHTRRGAPRTRFAFVRGNYDAFNAFNNPRAWMMACPGGEASWPEQSWELMRIFFPYAKLEGIYAHNCQHRPQGFYTPTPYGLCDVLPHHAAAALFGEYRYAVMTGWNTCDREFLRKMIAFVRGGGTLVLTLAHLLPETDRTAVLGGRLSLPDWPEICELLGEKPRGAGTDGDCAPRENRLGQGRVFWFDSFRFPAHPSIRAPYFALVERLAAENAALETELGFVTAREWVSVSVFDAEDRRTIYCLNTKWFDDAAEVQHALYLDGALRLELPVLRGAITVVSVFAAYTVVTFDRESDVIALDGKILRIQGLGSTRILIVSRADGSVSERTLELNGPAEVDLSLPEGNCAPACALRENA